MQEANKQAPHKAEGPGFLNLVPTLFGTGWDRAVALVLYALANVWFWWAIATQSQQGAGMIGTPTDGLRKALDALGIAEPSMIASIGEWFAARGFGFGLTFAVAAAVCATIFAKTWDSGPEMLTIVLTVISAESAGWFGPALALSATFVPAVIALMLAWIQTSGAAFPGGREFRWRYIGLQLRIALWPFATAIFLPWLLLVDTMNCYATEERYPEPASGAVPL